MSVLDRFGLDGRRLLVTGGSRGLGRAMALALAEAGADVALTGRDAASLERTAGEIRALGRRAWPIQADIGVPAQCEAACVRALAEHGPFDILINNVGGRRDPTPVVEMAVERWRELVDLNLTSTFVCSKIIGGAMVARGTGGRVINIASVNALVAGQNSGGRQGRFAGAGRAAAVGTAGDRGAAGAGLGRRGRCAPRSTAAAGKLPHECRREGRR
jgi:gluconate 5-dehydrogenase